MKSFYRVLLSLVFLCTLSSIYAQTTLTQELQADKAKKELENKGVEEDEIKAALLKKGIDLDNLKPEQIPGLEDEIKKVVTELESQKGEEELSSVKDIKTTITGGVDSLLEKQAKEVVGETAVEVVEDIEEGASLEEALANDLTKKLSNKYSAKTNIYGHHIFFDKSIDLFRTTSSSTTPNSYVLDVGDKIAINIFGASQADLLYEIEEDGFIRPTGMYKVYLKGVTIGKAKELLKNRFRQAYMFQDGQFNVDLHTARTININLFGEVNQPGSYTISALNTALNAIIAAGGINSKASVRHIKIISGGKEKTLDVYDFLAEPKMIYDYYLSNNDIIFVPKSDRLVSATGGGFKVNGKFELAEGEHFKELLSYTQGLSTRAYKDVITYKSFDGEERTFANYAYDEFLGLNIHLQNGDAIGIRTST
ncbi:MAG: polysaccharide biosynthesis/export family protein, partial [Bacteroidia bacterium]